MQKFFIVVITIAVLGLLTRVAIGLFSSNREATGLTKTADNKATLSGCDNLQNCTASTATKRRNLVKALDYDVPPEEVIETFSRLIESQSGTNIITKNSHYLHATYKTALLGYIDDLELLLDESTGVLNIRSASRLGQSDFGANRKRIEALRELANSS